MNNIGQMMKQAQAMQQKITDMQAKVGEIERAASEVRDVAKAPVQGVDFDVPSADETKLWLEE